MAREGKNPHVKRKKGVLRARRMAEKRGGFLPPGEGREKGEGEERGHPVVVR